MAVLLDPSLLLRPWTLEDVRAARPVSVSATFLELARDGALSDAALGFFGPRRLERSELAELARSVATDGGFDPYRAEGDEGLGLEIRDPVVRAILLDEWSLLRRGSWIASRVRRPFTAFVRGGAAAVELEREALEAWDDMPRLLAREQRLRVAANWLAVGATDRVVEALPGRPAGAFLLFED